MDSIPFSFAHRLYRITNFGYGLSLFYPDHYGRWSTHILFLRFPKMQTIRNIIYILTFRRMILYYHFIFTKKHIFQPAHIIPIGSDSSIVRRNAFSSQPDIRCSKRSACSSMFIYSPLIALAKFCLLLRLCQSVFLPLFLRFPLSVPNCH